ncbi:lasso peptide biosynthesis PqqD family chaperone [Streptomyces sp. NBC_00887]|uniref:lasso peptide biosynthesis PqqD family chaperone n=1 Tax=Streptomyces sp. NBC_00887 TaxID=2975859 RepID=UPI002F918209|nr:lasso peptide biosynthesis PqqD family chaperone [Streptomyces sp. NBC_00887]
MTFALAPDVSVTDTEYGTVLLNERTGRYWLLNDTGAMVLRALLDGTSSQGIVASLCQRFPDAGTAQAEQDVENLLHALRVAKVAAS